MRRVFGPLTQVYILCGMLYLGFAIQIFGISMTDQQLNPILKPNPLWMYVYFAGIGLTVTAPLLAFALLGLVPAAAREAGTGAMKIVVWIVATVGFVVGLAQGLWTCSGHPTWIQGYPFPY